MLEGTTSTHPLTAACNKLESTVSCLPNRMVGELWRRHNTGLAHTWQSRKQIYQLESRTLFLLEIVGKQFSNKNCL